MQSSVLLVGVVLVFFGFSLVFISLRLIAAEKVNGRLHSFVAEREDTRPQ